MSWFKKPKPEPPRAVCAKCHHVFEPRKSAYEWENSLWGLCWECDKPERDKRKRIRDVKEWAGLNWEKLEPQMKRDKAKAEKKAAKQQSKAASQLYEQMRAQQGKLLHQGQLWQYSGTWQQRY